MKKSIAVFIVVLILILGNFSVHNAMAQTYKWRLTSFLGPGNMWWDAGIPTFCDLIEKRTNGKIVITPYPSGAIVPNNKISQAISDGSIEIAHNSAAYDLAYLPEAYVLANLPLSFTDAYQPIEFWYSYKDGAAWDIVQNAFEAKGIHLSAVLNINDALVIMTSFPINKLADLQGKKIRTVAKWNALINTLEAAPVSMGLGDVYMALQTKAIDGVVMAISGLEDWKWKEVLTNVIMPPLQYGAACTMITSKKVFDQLSPDLQKIIDDTAREINEKHWIPYAESVAQKVRESAAKAGVSIGPPFTGNDLDRYLSANLSLWKDAGNMKGKTPELVELLKSYCEYKGLKYPK